MARYDFLLYSHAIFFNDVALYAEVVSQVYKGQNPPYEHDLGEK